MVLNFTSLLCYSGEASPKVMRVLLDLCLLGISDNTRTHQQPGMTVIKWPSTESSETASLDTSNAFISTQHYSTLYG